MSPKKRKSSKRPPHRKGLSGNPQRRALQLGQDTGLPADRSALLGLARMMAGAVEPAPWWADSHRNILARARSLGWPSTLGALEELTCQVVGDEFFDRLEKDDSGFHQNAWLRALIEATGKAARDAVTAGSDDWSQLWALLRGLTLITPSGAGDENTDKARGLFPDIQDPLETARAEAEKTAALLTERGMLAGSPAWVHGAQAAGEPLLARDVYGSRFLLAVPFGYPDGDSDSDSDGEDVPVDHWYAWDLDMCWIEMAVNAGTFGSAEDALSEWSDAVGPAAADATLASCPEDIVPRLLHHFLLTGPFADMLQGREPRPLIREHYRLRRRAREVTARTDVKIFDPASMVEEFGTWYRTRHGDTPDAVREAAETIADHWGPHRCPDERTFLACSPHRIRQTAILVRDKFFAEQANPAMRLFPEWTQWCIDRTGLADPAAERALQEAAAEASYLMDDATDKSPRRLADDEPFRPQE